MFGENAMDRSATDAVRRAHQVAVGQRVVIHCDALLVRTHPKRF